MGTSTRKSKEGKKDKEKSNTSPRKSQENEKSKSSSRKDQDNEKPVSSPEKNLIVDLVLPNSGMNSPKNQPNNSLGHNDRGDVSNSLAKNLFASEDEGEAPIGNKKKLLKVGPEWAGFGSENFQSSSNFKFDSEESAEEAHVGLPASRGRKRSKEGPIGCKVLGGISVKLVTRNLSCRAT